MGSKRHKHIWLWVATGMGVKKFGTKEKPYTTYKCPRCNEVKVVETFPKERPHMNSKKIKSIADKQKGLEDGK